MFRVVFGWFRGDFGVVYGFPTESETTTTHTYKRTHTHTYIHT